MCVPAEENPLHFFEDRVVSMTASHEHFSVKPLDKRSNIMNAFLSVHQSSMMWGLGGAFIHRPDLRFFGHFVDAEREGNVVRVVITPYKSACYEFVNEDQQNELEIDTHIRTGPSRHSQFILVLCWQSLLLELSLLACILLFPSYSLLSLST